MSVRDRVVIITGGGGGLGRTFCVHFAGLGSKVLAADIMEVAAMETARLIRERGGVCEAVRVDVTREEDVERMAVEALERWGRIDVLINNAAVYYGIGRKPFHEISSDEWDRMMAVNIKGPWLCTKAIFPAMSRQGRGKVVNIASEVFFTGSFHLTHYVTSKGAVVGLTRALARELGDHGICVNAVAPGFTHTEASRALMPDIERYDVSQNAIKRLGRPEDLLGVVEFLASEASDFITGQTIVVDGGRYMH